ncbi:MULTISPECIES: hypothetical protein [Bacillus subtilis group]|uniref:hypothetical protein n=1 Tax=Bacillus TaxID=1386 RepID=UPI0011A45A7F|nr:MULTISPECIES: hypothetical protein [Bacillus subtilis group]MBT3123188.1 hypothetical protein [Bacillus inaquosorum]MCB5337357.1 hypothetical protein [Bacillus amyloliquefaciens]MCF7615395.1 hypothetical protein [Bacillus subtilis]QWK35320.1 hypothetical protein KM843_19335 [Bacillus velezensis]
MGEMFFKKQKPVHDLTDDQLDEAFILYKEKVQDELIKDLEKTYNFSLDDEDTVDFIKHVIDLGIKEGMSIALDTHSVTDYYKSVKNIETDPRCGVVVKEDDSFYGCGVGEHWATLTEIIKSRYKNLYKPFIELTNINPGLDEYGGITRVDLDSFILNNFRFVGEGKKLLSYIEDAAG